MGAPGAPGRRWLVVGQHVRYLDNISRFPQMSGCGLPARCTDHRPYHKNKIQAHAPWPSSRFMIAKRTLAIMNSTQPSNSLSGAARLPEPGGFSNVINLHD